MLRKFAPFQWLMLAAAAVVLIIGVAVAITLPVKQICPPGRAITGDGACHLITLPSDATTGQKFVDILGTTPTENHQTPLRILIVGGSIVLALILAAFALKGVEYEEYEESLDSN